jgi:hypothetical protein
MGFLGLIIMVLPLLLGAAEKVEPPKDQIQLLDTTQSLLGGQVNRLANRLDLFFADQRADDELARSRIRVRRFYEVRERAKLEEETQIRFNIRLPHLEEKFKFEWKNRKKDPKIPTNENKILNTLDTSWQYRSDIGINANIPPRLFFRNRLRKNWQTGTLIHRFVEEVSWFSDRDWEQTASIDTDHSISANRLFRFSNSSQWEITRKNFRTGHGPSIRQQLTENDALSYGLTMSTVVNNGSWFVDNFRLAPVYRRNLYQQWLYLDLTPGIDFPKAWSFRRTPFIAFQLEGLFGGI